MSWYKMIFFWSYLWVSRTRCLSQGLLTKIRLKIERVIDLLIDGVIF